MVVWLTIPIWLRSAPFERRYRVPTTLSTRSGRNSENIPSAPVRTTPSFPDVNIKAQSSPCIVARSETTCSTCLLGHRRSTLSHATVISIGIHRRTVIAKSQFASRSYKVETYQLAPRTGLLPCPAASHSCAPSSTFKRSPEGRQQSGDERLCFK